MRKSKSHPFKKTKSMKSGSLNTGKYKSRRKVRF